MANEYSLGGKVEDNLSKSTVVIPPAIMLYACGIHGGAAGLIPSIGFECYFFLSRILPSEENVVDLALVSAS
jgi:hypothetical protein